MGLLLLQLHHMSWSVNFVWLANLLIIELRSLPGIGRFFLWDGKIKQISLKIKGMGSSSDLRPTSWLHWKSARHSELKNFYTIIYHIIYSSGFILVPKLRPIHIWTNKIITIFVAEHEYNQYFRLDAVESRCLAVVMNGNSTAKVLMRSLRRARWN